MSAEQSLARQPPSSTQYDALEMEVAMSHLLIQSADMEAATLSPHPERLLRELYVLSNEELYYLWRTFPESIVLEHEKAGMDCCRMQLSFSSVHDGMADLLLFYMTRVLETHGQ